MQSPRLTPRAQSPRAQSPRAQSPRLSPRVQSPRESIAERKANGNRVSLSSLNATGYHGLSDLDKRLTNYLEKNPTPRPNAVNRALLTLLVDRGMLDESVLHVPSRAVTPRVEEAPAPAPAAVSVRVQSPRAQSPRAPTGPSAERMALTDALAAKFTNVRKGARVARVYLCSKQKRRCGGAPVCWSPSRTHAITHPRTTHTRTLTAL